MKKIKQIKNERLPKDQITDEEFKKVIRCLDLTKL